MNRKFMENEIENENEIWIGNGMKLTIKNINCN